jgi:hypothetical protein
MKPMCMYSDKFADVITIIISNATGGYDPSSETHTLW